MTVYLARDHRGAVKIGYTCGDPKTRVRQLQTSSASELELLAVLPGAPREVEKELQRRFARYHLQGEWFEDADEIEVEFRRRSRPARVVVSVSPDGDGLIVSTTGDVHRLDVDDQETDDSVRLFWKTFRERFVWDLLPFTFLLDLYLAWLTWTSPSGTPVGRQVFASDLVSIVANDPDWHCEDKRKKVRTGLRMSKPEPLIAEYGLKKWMDPNYKGSDPARKSHPVLQANYRGLLRTSTASGASTQTSSNINEGNDA